MVYDGARNRVVVFGGLGPNGSRLDDTWEWDGSTWIHHTPATSPAPRYLHAMAYDAARGRVVLFGGLGPTGLLDDTWEWDGSAWIERFPTTRPPVRAAHAMAFDAARGRVVLFGGDQLGGYRDDTWDWDGNTWIESVSAPNPPRRGYGALAYDGTRGRVVLFGGYGPSGYLDDLWEFFSCGAAEACNGLDDGNDGCFPPDELDADGDGYVGCAPWSGSDPLIVGGDDCRPADVDSHPAAPETCDGRDNDCDDVVPAGEADADFDGFRICSGDCDDGNPLINPSRTEICNSIDDDCDSVVDGPAGEVDGVIVSSLGDGAIRLSWDPATGASAYEIVRGLVSDLSATHMGECQAADIAALFWDDVEVPPPTQAFLYLVRGVNAVCGAGTLGFGVDDQPRVQTGSECP
jgi:hypothetical protein